MLERFVKNFLESLLVDFAHHQLDFYFASPGVQNGLMEFAGVDKAAR